PDSGVEVKEPSRMLTGMRSCGHAPMKKVHPICQVLLGGCLLIFLSIILLLATRSGVSKANFDRIDNGMTQADVEAIFGEPKVTEQVLMAFFDARQNAVQKRSLDPFEMQMGMAYWISNNDIAAIRFKENGKAEKCGWVPKERLLNGVRR